MILGLFQRVEGRYFWPLFHGATEAAKRAGARIIVNLSPTPRHQRELEGEALRNDFLFSPARYDGLLFAFGGDGLHEFAAQWAAEGHPVVLLGRRADHLPCVVNDNRSPMREVVRALAGRGHRRIAFVAGLPGNYVAEERLLGYLEGIEQSGLEADPELVIAGNFAEEAAREAVRTALERGLDATAFVCANDLSAFGTLDVLREFGRAVPDEVEVIGFDNQASSQWTNPPLSTFDPQLYRIGYVGTEELIRRIRGEPGSDEVTVPTIYCPRASCRNPVASEAAAGEATGFDPEQARQTAAALKEYQRQHEVAALFQAATMRLRELTFEAAEEPIVLARFWQTLRSLNLARAGLYLYPAGTAAAGETAGRGRARWYWRDVGTGWHYLDPAAQDTDERDLWRLLPVESSAVWVVMPLLYEREVLGVVAIGAELEKVVYYPELTNQLSVGLHGARMHFALKRTHAELVEASRLAGLAEMATGVLHNIGNALNSVTTAVGVTAAQLQKSRMVNVQKTARLLAEHRADLAHFLQNDPRGQQVVGYLEQLGAHLLAEQETLRRDLEDLQLKVDHINQIVAAQQSYAQHSGLIETMEPAELFDHALRLSEASLLRHRVAVRREFQSVPPVHGMRQKILQILVNLIRNAKEAMDGCAPAERQLILGLELTAQGRVGFTIRDHGVGIAPENLASIFAFGFSTKAGGRGFGLHTSALAAKEMGGALQVESAGLGQGARFRLELPAAEASEPAAAARAP